MAKIPVGGATGLITAYLLPIMGWADAATERADCLNAINYAERYIANADALLYLNREWPIVVNNGAAAAYVAIPTAPAVDVGKDFTIEDENGMPLQYCAPDELKGRTVASYDRVATGPAGYTVVIDPADEVPKFKFNPPVPAGSRNYLLIGQRAIIALADAGGSFSLLPEGYEITLLLPIAEQWLKQRKHEIDAAMLDPQTQRELDSFFEKQRVNKKHATTDKDLERRKIEEVQLESGV